MPICLSIQQPWSWLIANGHKDIENRDWNTSYRGWVLIHAGKRVDEMAFSRGGLAQSYWQRYACFSAMPLRVDAYETGGIVGIARLVRVVTHSDSPWFRGTYGFVFEEARPLPFLPLRGQRFFFAVAPEIVAGIP